MISLCCYYMSLKVLRLPSFAYFTNEFKRFVIFCMQNVGNPLSVQKNNDAIIFYRTTHRNSFNLYKLFKTSKLI